MPDWKQEVRAAIAHLNLEPGHQESIVEELAEHLHEKYEELLTNDVPEVEAYRVVMEQLNRQKLDPRLCRVFRSQPTAVPPPGRAARSKILAGLAKDIHVSLRLLRLNPGLAIVAILSLALGIGANTAIFELIDAVILRALPVPDSQALAEVPLLHASRTGSSVSRQHEISSAIWQQLQQRQQAFSSIAAWSTERFDLGHGGESRYADGMWVSGRFFDTLQVNPSLGRLFSQTDDYLDCGIRGVVISSSFWQSEFGGRADVLGRSVSLNRRSFPVIGVTPPGFSGLEVGRKFDVVLPLCTEPSIHNDDVWTNSPTTWWLAVIGRLKPGWKFDQATAQLDSISPGIFAATLPPRYDAVDRHNYLRFRFQAVPAATGVSSLRKQYKDPLWLLLAISGLVLLIACANIANLMLARASARQQEMALRLALGASRARLIRQLLMESLLLSAIGGFAGAGLAYVLSKGLIGAISTSQDQVFLSLSPDWRVLAFTTALVMLTCVIFGVAPAFHAANTEPGLIIKTGGRGLITGRQRFLLRRGFVISQVAFSLVLVVTALLFVRSFENLVNLDAGFEQEHILVVEFDASPLKLPMERRLLYKREVLAQVRAIPGVISAAETAIVPLSGNRWNDSVDIPAAAIERKIVNFSRVSSDYFQTLDTPMIAGRDFTDSDTLNAPPVAIVNQAFARTILGGATPIGATFGVRQDAGKPDKIYRIVGLVGDTKYVDLREPYGPIAFVAETQDAAPDLDSTFVIRSAEDPSSLIASVKNTEARNNPEVALDFSVLRTSIREHLGRERLLALLSGFYGLLAATLSIIGLYGVMSYAVSRRTGEIGIRMALGATRGNVLRMILWETLTMLRIGLLMGITLVFAAGWAVKAMLFGLKPTDPLTLVVAITGLSLVALGASLLPAQRAAAIEPMQTLRQE